GAHAIQAGVVEGQPLSEEVREDVMGALRENFRPEFLNRIDEIVLFEPLARAHLTNIVELQLDRMRDLLRDRKLGLEVTPAAREVLAERGYDPVYGARPLKRAIQKNLQDPLAMQILQGAFQPGDTVKVDAGDEGLTFSATNEKEAGDKDADAGAPPPLHSPRSHRRRAAARASTSRGPGPWCVRDGPETRARAARASGVGAGEDLRAGFGHQQRVLELRGALAVEGDGGPLVIPGAMTPVAHGDHGLDGEGHPRLHDRGRRGFIGVGDLQGVVETLADAVATEGTHHPEALPFGIGLD